MSNAKKIERLMTVYPDLFYPKYSNSPLATSRYYKNLSRPNRKRNCEYTIKCTFSHMKKKKKYYNDYRKKRR